MVDGSSMIGFPLVIAGSERDMPGIEPGPLGWQTSTLTTELQEVRSAIFLSWAAMPAARKTIVLRDRFKDCR